MQQTRSSQTPSTAPIVYTPQSDGALTTQDVQGMRVKLEHLRDELQDAASRRERISGQLRSADSRALPGLQERLGVLDARIMALEKDISATGEQLRNAPPGLFASTQDPSEEAAFRIANQVTNDLVPIVAILSIFVFLPFTIAISRFIWRRAVPAQRAVPAVQTDHETKQRLEQLQQSMDTIAIEVERISEGQRFVTKIMSDRTIGAGAAEPVRAPQKSAVSTER